MNLNERIEPLLLQVEKPARYIGGELNSVIKNNEEIDIDFGFCFPDTYEIAMSYLGLQIIYHVLNKEEGVYCQRIFAPNNDMEALMRKNEIPLFTIEKKQPVTEMDVIGFTLQYELSYTNVLNLLDLAQIPFKSAQRGEEYPIICAGGNCSFNPEPLAEIFDFFMIGDGEDLLVEVTDAMKAWKRRGGAKRELLENISKLKGIYVPSFYETEYYENGKIKQTTRLFDGAPQRVQKRIVADLDQADYPTSPLVPLIDVVHDRAVVEIFRGCTRGCRFCQAGMICRPVRERSKEKIIKIANTEISSTGHDELSLLSLSTSDYSQIESLVEDLMQECKHQDVSLSLPSLRLDSFSFKVLNEIQEYRKSGLTFAPEAGTQRLRDVVNKTITDEHIYNAVEKAIRLGWNNIKLYFMIGLPTETDEDLDGIVEIAKRINEIYLRVTERKTKFHVTISISNFVPKPHTPFQWEAQDPADEFNRKQLYLKDRLRNIKGVAYQYHGTDTSCLEAVLSRGDRRVGTAVIRAWELGCKFDSWNEHFDFSKWIQAFTDVDLDPLFYAYGKAVSDYTDILPWDIIDCGVSKEFMIKESKSAKAEMQTQDCRNGCTNCGISSIAECYKYIRGRDL